MGLTRYYPEKRSLFSIIIFTVTILCLIGCGGGGGGGGSDGGDTASIRFSVQWDRSRNLDSDIRYGVDDCLDVNTVSAAVYAGSQLIQTGGPWNCADGHGTLAGVPAGNTVRVAVAGHDANGRTLYRGESTDRFFLPGGETVDAGLVVAGSFVPTLISPYTGSYFYNGGAFPELSWNAVRGARLYRVSIAKYGDSPSPILTVLSYATTYQTDPQLFIDAFTSNYFGIYQWSVQAVDRAGNRSDYSDSWSFTLLAGNPAEG
jgi:hypothetical protein